MRINESAQTGSLGESEVERNFRLIGWNSMPYGSQDMGTDYLVEARDARRFSRGLIIGVQVKSGESYFTRPSVDDCGIEQGWWYYESNADHFDYWMAYSLPSSTPVV